MKRRDNLEDLGADGTIKLQQILGKQGFGSVYWINLAQGGASSFRFHKKWGIS
jgi:hypothetical protein